MTLNTHIYFTDKVDHREVFNKVNDLLHIPDSRIEEEGIYEYDTAKYEISNRLGQGFDAWVMSFSRVDGSPFFDEWDEDELEDDEEDRRVLAPPHFVKVSMDTGYAYQGPSGEGCSLLHARVLVDLYNWLQERGQSFSWKNEFTQEIHEGIDGIEAFIGNGDSAMEWFTTVVLPVVPHMIGED